MHSLIVHAALYIGYAVMIAGGIAIALLLLWLIAEKVWKFYRGVLNTADLHEALSEWKQNHPDKIERFNKRNG